MSAWVKMKRFEMNLETLWAKTKFSFMNFERLWAKIQFEMVAILNQGQFLVERN